MVMNEDKVIEYFEKECKLFNAHSYINFVSGFELTNKLYARFVQPKPLNVRKFEKQVGSFHDAYSVKDELLKKEMADRLQLLHTIGTVHLMENYFKKCGACV